MPQVKVGPVIAPDAAAVADKASVLTAPVPQALVPDTEMLPVVNPLLDTTMLLVP